MEEEIRVWLVERTYSDDEQNVIILKYATPSGDRVLRKERALTSFSQPDEPVVTELTASPEDLSPVLDTRTQEWYRHEVARRRKAGR